MQWRVAAIGRLHQLPGLRLGSVHPMNKNLSLDLWAAVLLLIGGLVHLIPPLYTGLAELTGGVPWLQIIVGLFSVLVALVMFAGEGTAQ